MDTQNWQIQMRKGILDFVILNLLSHRRSHGYEIVQSLKNHKGLTIREGNVYPILQRLGMDGLITSESQPSRDGPPRKYFSITSAGREALEQMNHHWDELIDTVRQIRGEQ
ncbi:MAG: PadR family transcriptional regulator [Planctomycetes bacterium]|nr:PadR family transcriptional regulator [Planctomycetota bacterium]